MKYILAVILISVLVAVVRSRQNQKLEQQVLAVLAWRGEMYGLQIIMAVEQEFGSKLGFGNLYPSLRRLERQGLLISRWGEQRLEVRGGARRRYYQRTGRKRMKLTDFQHKAVDWWDVGVARLRLEAAHRAAVKRTLEFIEKHYAQTRVKGERVQTDNLTIAMWHHDTSGELDPHLHTHCVVMNFN